MQNRSSRADSSHVDSRRRSSEATADALRARETRASSIARATSTRATPSRWLVPASIALAALALYACTQQSYYFGDGRGLIGKANADAWSDHNLAYFPLAQLARSALAPLCGNDAEPALRCMSALSSALAIGVLASALLHCGVRASIAALVAILVALTPVVWFHATCIEVLAPHLLGASCAFHLLAGRAAAGRLRGDALVPALAFALLFVSHMSGALWMPALAWIAWRDERWRLPRRLGAALAIGALVALAWIGLAPSRAHSSSLIGLALANLFGTRELPAFRDELLRPLAWLLALALLGIVLLARGRLARGGLGRANGRMERMEDEHEQARAASDAAHATPAHSQLATTAHALAVPACIAIATYLLVVTSMPLHERGAYYVGLVPWLAWLGAHGLEQFRAAATRRLALAALVACIAAQAQRGREFASELDRVDPALAWIEDARTELGAGGVVLTATQEERVAVLGHSRLECFALHGPLGLDLGLGELSGPSGLEVARQIASWARAERRRVAITRTLLEAPDSAAVLDGVEARDRLRPGRSREYQLLDLDAAPSR